MTSDSDTAAAVKVLLDAAQLTVSDEEFERFARTYGALRSQADALYQEEVTVGTTIPEIRRPATGGNSRVVRSGLR